MRLLLWCFECKLWGAPVTVEIEDDGIYDIVCSKGHRSVVTLSNHKFEILFEMGVLAFEDGYTREAVATLAASVEEFFRFFVKCAFAKHKLYEGDRFDEASQFWKLVSRAEPQLGAFAAFYFLEFGKCPPYPDSKSTEFRNSVIHRGQIPKTDEVINYADKIVKFMIPVYRELRKGSEALTAIGIETITGLRKRNEKPSGAFSYPTAVFHLTLLDEEPSFVAALEYVRKNKDRYFTAAQGQQQFGPS
jgi:hypothetical protein